VLNVRSCKRPFAQSKRKKRDDDDDWPDLAGDHHQSSFHCGFVRRERYERQTVDSLGFKV
jgi:hypothetical protein